MCRINCNVHSIVGMEIDCQFLNRLIINIFLCNNQHTHVTYRNGMGKLVGAFGLSYLIGAKVHSGRVTKKMKMKHLKDQKALYTQYYNDIYKLEEQKAEQQAVIEQLQKALS